MSTNKIRFGRDVLISAVATGLKSLRNLLLIRFISFNLSIAEYGIWEQISIGIALILPWITFQLPSALLRFLPGINDKKRWRDDFFSVLSFISVTTTLFSFFVWILLKALLPYSHWAPFAQHATFIAPLIPLSAIVNTCITLLRALRRLYLHSTITLFQYFAEFALIGALLGHGNDLTSALLALVMVRLVIVIVVLRFAILEFGFALPTFAHLKEYLTYSIPLIPNTISYRIFDAGDRFILSYFVGHSAVGLYAATYSIGSFFTTIISPINMVLLPLMAELWNKNRQTELSVYLIQSIRFSSMISLPALAGTVYLSPQLLTLLILEIDSQTILCFTLLGFSFLTFGIGILGGNILATAGKTRNLFVIGFFIALLNILLNLIFVPLWEILGAAAATLISHLIYSTVVLFQSNRIVPISFPWKSVLNSTLGSISMIGFLYFCGIYISKSLPFQIIFGVCFYTLFMVVSGGISKRELSFFLGIIRDLRD